VRRHDAGGQRAARHGEVARELVESHGQPAFVGPARSIFMITVVDQVSPWLTPSNALANRIQDQLGAHMSRKGTGMATSQPPTSTCLRPNRSEKRPAK
jgi:hypothetical protein